MADILAEMLDLQILRSKGMLILLLANLFGMMGFYAPIVFAADRAVGFGVSETDAALLLSIMGKSVSPKWNGIEKFPIVDHKYNSEHKENSDNLPI